MAIRILIFCVSVAGIPGCQALTGLFGKGEGRDTSSTHYSGSVLSYDFSEAEVDRIREVIASIEYPQEVGYTIGALELAEDITPYRDLYADSFPMSRPAIATRTTFWYAITPRLDLVIIEDFTVYDDREGEHREVSAEIKVRSE